jgi:PTH1 family peptidyl-tRNA hydrolase
MKILVGLGNPGEKYERNRHNVGFGVLDAIAERHGAPAWRKRFQGMATEVDIARQRYLLLKPATYMNESGRSVSEAVRFFKMSPADVIVFHDEIDLEPGKLRVKFGGGHAGHNGLKSLSAHIGNEYQRVRIGVGHPGNRDAVAHYVLHDFARADRDWLEPLLAAIAQALPSLLSGQDAKFMNDVGRTARPQVSGKPAKAAEAPKAAPAPAPVVDAKPAPVPESKPAAAAPAAAKKKAEPAMAGPAPGSAQESGFAKLKAWLRRA